MARQFKSIRCSLFIISVMVILATSALAKSNGSFSEARNIDPSQISEQVDQNETKATSSSSEVRADVDGHLVIYVAEPIGRWLDNGQTFPPNPPKPFGNAVIAYPFDEDVYINESFDLTFDWDAAAAGFGDITEDNIKVVAALFKTEPVYTHFAVNGVSDLYFDAYHLIAAAQATSGVPGSNYSDGDYTHTVFIEEVASTW